MWDAMDATLSFRNLIGTLRYLHRLYENAVVSKEPKFELSPIAVEKHPELQDFPIYRVART